MNFEPVQINGIKYYTSAQFALIIGKTETAIRRLCRHKEEDKRLKSIKIGKTIMIPETEITEYEFYISGTKRVRYKFDEDGKLVIAKSYGEHKDIIFNDEDEE